MTDQAKLNLVQKLAQIGNEIEYVEKLGANKTKDGKINYNYVKASDVAKEIRHKLFERNIIITIDEKEISTQGSVKTYSGGELALICVKADFTFRDGDSGETLTQSAYGVGMDGGDKAIYKAKTGALKYVLRGIALIPDEKDDPEHDVDPEQVNAAIAEAGARFDEREKAFDDPDARVPQIRWKSIEEACKAHGHSTLEQSRYLAEFNYVQWSDLKNKEFDRAIKWASSPARVPQDLISPTVEAIGMVRSQKSGCEACGSKVVEAGVSKKPPYKAYAAFCSNPKCATRQKPKRPAEQRTEDVMLQDDGYVSY